MCSILDDVKTGMNILSIFHACVVFFPHIYGHLLSIIVRKNATNDNILLP